MISDWWCATSVRKPNTKANLDLPTILAIAPASALRSRRRRVVLYAWLLLTIAPLIPVRAAVILPSIFTDGMVLQTGVPVPIWGKASPWETVSVEFASQKRHAPLALTEVGA